MTFAEAARNSSGRIRTAVYGSKVRCDWPLHHGTERWGNTDKY